ncbi:MAG: LacI family DNA-binding transcriptional regulator [Chthoniobacteraceae bacterium]
MPPRITQRDIAKAAGVSHVTVSLALRDHHSISKETRDRIKAIAEEIGYAPDPMLVGLSAYRRSARPAAYQSNIGWINGHQNPADLYIGEYREYYAGTLQRAKELGYILESIHLSEFGYDPQSIMRVLRSKGIQGLVLAPSEKTGAEFRIDFSRFSAVRFGYSYNYPVLHTLSNAQFRTVTKAVERILAMGYERIGMILSEDVNKRTAWNFQGGFNAAMQEVPPRHRVAPISVNSADKKGIAHWLQKHKVDCILGQGYWLLYILKELGIRVPDDIGYADIALNRQEAIVSGMMQNSFLSGVAAVDLLNGMMQRSETGIPEVPMHLYTEGQWFEGSTVKAHVHPH